MGSLDTLLGGLRTAQDALLDVLNLGKLKTKWLLKSWLFQSFNGLVVISSLLFFLGAIFSAYFYVFPAYQPVTVIVDNEDVFTSDIGMIPLSNNETIDDINTECNVFDGRWVSDESYPLYNGSQCPFTERGFNCLANGRRDQEYLRWRWQPKSCDIPRFDANVMLEWLRGKRVVFVGDSLSRTQWESMICMLMTGIDDPRSVYEINGHRITRRIRHLAVRFSSFNFTVEFYRSIFLVQPGQRPKRAPKRVKTAVQLDMLDDISDEWVHSDILVFNTGHWWTPTKLFDMGVESRKNCEVTRQPMSRIDGMDKHPYSDAIIRITKNVSVPVTVLHVTPMGAFRSDAHVGTWSDNPRIRDCSHWCLPGVPDMWNELLFSNLLSYQRP